MLVVPALGLHAQLVPEEQAPALVEDLPRAVRAAPDEIVRRNEGAGPIAPVERGLRLVASDARMAKGDVPELSVGDGSAVGPPPETLPLPAGKATRPAAIAAPARTLARSDARTAPGRVPPPKPPAIATRGTTGAPVSPLLRDHARWLWLAPVAGFFLMVIGWLVWARRRRDADQAYVLKHEEEAAFASVVAEVPFRPGAQLGKLPCGKEPPPNHLAPRRLVHALAGLKAELGDGPREDGGAPAIGHAG